MPATKSPEQALTEFVGEYYDDPLGFVMAAFPWGEPGTALEHEEGPDDNQAEFLRSFGDEIKARAFDGVMPCMPVQMAETSGHDTGKTALCGWVTCFILSTRPHSDGTITAGGYLQLESRTWPAVQYWMGMCCTRDWFDVMEGGIYHKKHPATWKVQIQSCKEQNAQSFAGQHAKRSTSWYWFDEASEVPNKIYEVAYNGLLDGEPMMFVLGQMVRNTGEFYRICFGDLRHRWNFRRVDSRTARFPNKELIERTIADYGIDSDYVRVRILGYPPSASELQYIDKGRVELAMKRRQNILPHEPLIAGFDVSGGGKAWNVIRFRRGLDGDVLPPIRIPGEHDPERSQRVGICAELLSDTRPERQVAAMFVDSAFGAPIVVRLQAMGFTNVYETNFGGASPDSHCQNMRAYMYMKAKEWLLLGALPEKDELLAAQLCLPGYHTNTGGKLVMESKADIQDRGEQSPDDADAFVLTFAQAIAIPPPPRPTGPPRVRSAWT